MATYARPVERLITELSKLPSIGPRSAQRIAFHVIRGKKEDAIGLAEALQEDTAALRASDVERWTVWGLIGWGALFALIVLVVLLRAWRRRARRR